MPSVPPFEFRAGSSPLLVSMPHVGVHVPPPIAARLTGDARGLPDTDWHVDTLYDFLGELGASTIAATHSRYVVDLNRPPDDANLYPGRRTPGLVPTATFAGGALYREGAEPGADEIRSRIDAYWQPYHDKIAATLAELRTRHGTALLWDAHSIRSIVPALFEGTLPDLNFGTGGGSSCTPAIAAELTALAANSGYRWVLDGRFKGGYITRHYGRPADRVHAIQLELAQCCYMHEDDSNAFDQDRARPLRSLLRALLAKLLCVQG